jgi:imidazolonepropionase-like amidohydrolase
MAVTATAVPGTQSTPASAPGVVAFTGGRVFVQPGSRNAIPSGVIIVKDGKVLNVGPSGTVTIPAGARVVDVSGKTIIPGLIAAHAHVSDVQGVGPRAYTDENTLRQLGVFARYGVTTVWSLGGEQAPAFRARDTQATSSLDRARLFVAGEVITGRTPDEARSRVAAVAAMKPDIIKIRVDDNLGAATKMTPDVYRAVIDEAHRRNLRVAAHLYYLDDAKDLLKAGVDMIAHSVRDKDVDDELIALLKARNVPYCPTLTRELSTFVYESAPAFFNDPFFQREADKELVAQLLTPAKQEAMRASQTAQTYKAALAVAKRNLKRLSDAGVLIAMGTDSGAFPERFEGYFEHVELEMMAEAGMTPVQILKSATVDAAAAMKQTDTGRLVPGMWADFVVLDRDPLQDIRNTRSISSVWIAGNQVKR